MNKTLAIFAVVLSVFLFTGTAMASSTAVAGASASADPSAVGIVDQTFEADKREYKDMPRGYAVGTEVVYPGMPSYFGPDKPGPNTMDLRVILEMKPDWTRDCLTATGTKAKTNTRARFFVPTRKSLGKEFKAKDSDAIKILLGNPPEDAKLVGVVMVRARDTKATTLEVMADAGRHALDIPGATLYVVAYNSAKVVKTGGWGIGFHSSMATANGTNDLSSVSSGGTGWSTGEAGYEDKPWIHGYVVILP
jgi:hypothetical protein